MITTRWLTSAVLALLATAGCTHLYVPRKIPVEGVEIVGFASRPSVQLVNDAASSLTLIGSQGVHKWVADFKDWTNVAIELCSTELAQRNAQIGGDGGKVLKLSVHRANLIWGFAAIRCILNLRVETADGRTFEFEGNNASPLTVYRAMDGALSRAVGALLASPAVRSYLEAH